MPRSVHQSPSGWRLVASAVVKTSDAGSGTVTWVDLDERLAGLAELEGARNRDDLQNAAVLAVGAPEQPRQRPAAGSPATMGPMSADLHLTLPAPTPAIQDLDACPWRVPPAGLRR